MQPSWVWYCWSHFGWIQYYLHGFTRTQADVKFLHALLDIRNVAVPSCFPYELELKTKKWLPAWICWRQSIRAAAAHAVRCYMQTQGLSEAGVCGLRCWQWVSAGRRRDSIAKGSASWLTNNSWFCWLIPEPLCWLQELDSNENEKNMTWSSLIISCRAQVWPVPAVLISHIAQPPVPRAEFIQF